MVTLKTDLKFSQVRKLVLVISFSGVFVLGMETQVHERQFKGGRWAVPNGQFADEGIKFAEVHGRKRIVLPDGQQISQHLLSRTFSGALIYGRAESIVEFLDQLEAISWLNKLSGIDVGLRSVD